MRRLVEGMAVTCAMVFVGCSIAPRGARLYDVDGTQPVIHAVFQGTSDRGARGTLKLITPGGETCLGEYAATPSGGTAWGRIYYKDNQGTQGSGNYKSVSSLWYGSAIATGGGGTVYECEFRAEPLGAAHGACKDNRSHFYRLMFDAWGTVAPETARAVDQTVPAKK